jgi:hypothetical protein
MNVIRVQSCTFIFARLFCKGLLCFFFFGIVTLSHVVLLILVFMLVVYSIAIALGSLNLSWSHLMHLVDWCTSIKLVLQSWIRLDIEDKFVEAEEKY